MSDDELDYAIQETQFTLDELKAERTVRQAKARAEAIKANPFRVGQWVTTANSYNNYLVVDLNPKSVVVKTPWARRERIPLSRVLPATKMGR